MSKRSIRKRRHLPLCGDERVPGVAALIVTDSGTTDVGNVDLRTLVVGTTHEPVWPPYDPADWRTFESREDLRRACDAYMVKP